MLGMVGVAVDNSVKISQFASSDIYHQPNLFKILENNAAGISESDWIALLGHPYTPTYAKLNLIPFLSSVKAILDSLNNSTVTEKTLQFTYLRLLYDKNKKKVYPALVEHLLPLLIDNYATSAYSAVIIRDIILTKENTGLLEACLLVNMQNFTKSLIATLTSLDIVRVANFYLILCDRVHSKNKNRLMLNLYLKIQNNDVDRNVQLLDIIINKRLFQIKEDKEQGNITTQHLTSLLASLQHDPWCAIATKTLQLNYTIITLETACCYSNDVLLAQLFVTYQKVGRLVEMFRAVLEYSSRCDMSRVMGETARTSLGCTASKLTELQVTDLTKLFVRVLTDKTSHGTDEGAKKMKLDTTAFSFITECCYIVLSNHKQNLVNDTEYLEELQNLRNVSAKVPSPASDFLQLYFTKSAAARLLPTHFTSNVDKTHISSAEQLEQYISNLVHSESISDDLDTLFLHLPTYPHIILSNIGLYYDNLLTDHHFLVARHLLSTHNTDIIRDQLFSRLTDLHSVIVVCILQQLGLPYLEGKYLQDPLSDISMSSARDIIKHELEVQVSDQKLVDQIIPDIDKDKMPAMDKDKIPEIDYYLKIISQLSLNSCYLRLLITTWILCRRSRGSLSLLVRLCKPPPPLSSLPVVHGTHAGRVLAECLTYPGNHLEENSFLQTYLKSSILINSVDISEFVACISADAAGYASIVKCVVSVVKEKPGCLPRYQECLQQLNTTIIAVLDGFVSGVSDNEVCDAAKHRTVCQLLTACCNLSSLLSTADSLRYYSVLPNMLRNSNLALELKLELAQTYIDHMTDADSDRIIELSNQVLALLDDQHPIPDVINFSSTNSVCINNLYKNLPKPSAEVLLNQIDFTCDVISDIKSVPEIPLSLIPKLISHLDKKQVVVSLRGKTNTEQLSRCLLCLVQHSYPIHLFNSIFAAIFANLPASYSSNTAVTANIVRSCELIAKQREVARHHAPYILSTIFEYISKGNSALVSDVTAAVYPLFSVCVVQGFQFLQARLSPGAKELFVQLQAHYKHNVRYQGKI